MGCCYSDIVEKNPLTSTHSADEIHTSLLQHIDITIFSQNAICNVGTNTSNKQIIPNCSRLQRLAMGLKYYSLQLKNLNINNVDEFHYNDEEKIKSEKDVFLKFCTDVYPHLLDDYIHWIKKHSNSYQLIQIHTELRQEYGFDTCNILKCNMLMRHYRQRERTTENVHDDAKFIFYRDCYDRFHHHIFHLFEIGLRLESMSIVEEHLEYDATEDVDFLYMRVNKVFNNRVNEAINRQRNCGIDLPRYSKKNNKYDLCKLITKNTHSMHNNTSIDSNTFLDCMYSFIEEQNIVDTDELNRIKQYLSANNYDSDALKEDLQGLDIQQEYERNTQRGNIYVNTFRIFMTATSNIYNYIKYPPCIELMLEHIRNVHLSSVSFSTGYMFYYWDEYREMETEDIEIFDGQNKYSRDNGHSVSDLIIFEHYSCLKQEVLESKWVSVQEWDKNIVFKAWQYQKSKKVKRIVGRHKYSNKDRMAVSHLTCIILYCDWTDLCTDFSETFRKMDEFEPLENLKKRHSKYFYFSKGLVEAVLDFGITGINADDIYSDDERGPFFTGLSFILNIPSFAIYLKGPCSTSKDIEVAINFATRDGMIMELQNDTAHGEQQSFFDCSWVSKHVEENERLFIAADYRIRVQSIHLVETRQDFQDFAHAFYVLDHMLSAVSVGSRGIHIPASDINILRVLITNKLNALSQKQTIHIDRYIIDTFDLFLNSKSEILIDIPELHTHFRKLEHLILDFENSDDDNKKISFLSLFPNLLQVRINTAYTTTFDFDSFLSYIESEKSSIQYIIKAGRREVRNPQYDQHELYMHDKHIRRFTIEPNPYPEYIHKPSWLGKILIESIKETFEKKNWNVSLFYDEKTDHDCLFISKSSLISMVSLKKFVDTYEL
eukprot:124827_1